MGHGVNIFLPSPPNYVTRSPGLGHVVGEKEAEGSGDENGSNSSVGIIKCYLRTVPTIVIAHTFCASPDTRISFRRCLLIQGYFCAV